MSTLLVHRHPTTTQPQPELGFRFEKQAHSRTDVRKSEYVNFILKHQAWTRIMHVRGEKCVGQNESDALHGKRY